MWFQGYTAGRYETRKINSLSQGLFENSDIMADPTRDRSLRMTAQCGPTHTVCPAITSTAETKCFFYPKLRQTRAHLGKFGYFELKASGLLVQPVGLLDEWKMTGI